MALVGWLLVGVVGFTVALAASRRVADHATALAESTRLPPFIIGLALLAIGTDIPEIANSIITSAAGHGDLNVGDSIGSTLTQMTLVLGLLAFVGPALAVETRPTLVIGGLTVAAILFGVILVGDGRLSRLDGFMLVGAWIVTLYLSDRAAVSERGDLPPGRGRNKLRHAAAALMFLGVVAIGAAGAVAAMIELAVLLSVPEYVISFFGASIGTSMPELIVDVTAIRRGATALALGDVFGSSMVDATLSLGIGPLMFPVAVDASQAVRGGLFTAVAIALVVMLLGALGRHDRRTGIVLIAIYATAYLVVLR